MLKRNSFKSLGALIEKALSPIWKGKEPGKNGRVVVATE